jgi:hypothetical protein
LSPVIVCRIFSWIVRHLASLYPVKTEDRLSWQIFSWLSSVPPGECRGSRPTLKLSDYRFLPNPFQFIVLLSPVHPTLYIFSYWKNVVK